MRTRTRLRLDCRRDTRRLQRKACSDPQGPIASAERQILFNSLGIMLAIVIPTILATLGVAFWFRSSNGAPATCPISPIPAVSRCSSGRSRS